MEIGVLIEGRQEFMGKEIPVISGGFGEGRKCICDKTVAEIHGIEIKHIRELINNNIKRFKEMMDYIDLKVVVQDDYYQLIQLGYSKMQISKSDHIYLLSERGYAKLIKIMDSDLAWEIHDRLVDEYFTMRDEIIPKMTKLFLTLESELLELKSGFEKSTGCISNKIDTGFGSLQKINLKYEECVADSSFISKYRKCDVENIIGEIMAYGGYSSGQKVFSKIYQIMKQKCGIDVKQCQADYILQNPETPEISPWKVITRSPILFQNFMGIAFEMLDKLKNYGSGDGNMVSRDFEEALKQIKVIADNTFNSNIPSVYQAVYKCMEKIYGTDWTSIKYKNKIRAVEADKDLQEIFIRAVNYTWCHSVA